MNIKTRYFGEMEVSPDEIITLERGLFGFEEQTEFILIRFDDEDDTLLSLQSLKDSQLAFVVVNPFRVLPTYAPQLSNKDLKALGASAAEELHYYVIAVVHEDFKDTTVNLRCPVTINAETKKGLQIILEDGQYAMRHQVISQEGAQSC